MDYQKLEKILSQPKFRLKQARHEIFVRYISNWSEATVFPEKLREELNRECPLEIKHQLIISSDGRTAKALIELADGLKIEAVLMRHYSDRNTLCLSSQVGCPIGCSFCATGALGFKRNLSAEEIVDQFLIFARFLKLENEKIDNVVFMGMGEPLLNYGNVIKAIKILNDKEGINLGARSISISTVGIASGIRDLLDFKIQINLAFSLHAPNNRIRSKLIPSSMENDLDHLIPLLKKYVEKNKRRLMVEYVMIEKINDSDENAKELAKLIKEISQKLCLVNLIPYNETGKFKPSSPERIEKFLEVLEKSGIKGTIRASLGSDIEGSCGQLAAKAGVFKI